MHVDIRIITACLTGISISAVIFSVVLCCQESWKRYHLQFITEMLKCITHSTKCILVSHCSNVLCFNGLLVCEKALILLSTNTDNHYCNLWHSIIYSVCFDFVLLPEYLFQQRQDTSSGGHRQIHWSCTGGFSRKKYVDI